MACPDPPSVANGYIASNTSSVVTYACNDGFGMSGYAEVLCTGGVWDTLPYCYTRWNRNNNNFIETESTTSVYEDLTEGLPDLMIYGVLGSIGLAILALGAGTLLGCLHQCGCFDGPMVGFGGNYIYSDRRCCYWGDLNVKCCNFICSCCKARCCRYARKKSHGKVHFQEELTPEQLAIEKLLRKKKKKRRFSPIPCCVRAGRCLLSCLLYCCRAKRRNAKLAKQLALEEEERLINLAIEEAKAAEEKRKSKEKKKKKVINVKPAEEEKKVEEPPINPDAPKFGMVLPPKKEPEEKKEEKKAEPMGPPLLAIQEPPKPKPKPKPEPPKEEKEKEKAEPVGPPLLAIQQPPKKKKKPKPKPPKEEKKGYESVPSEDFVNVVESTNNPFGNNDVQPSKKFMEKLQTSASPNEKGFAGKKVGGKGNKVSTSPSADVTNLTFDKSINKKVAKWTDMNNDELWKVQPQQQLFSPEAPIKTKKTAEVIPLTSLFEISETPKKSEKEKKATKKKKKMEEDEGDNFGLPNVGVKKTRI